MMEDFPPLQGPKNRTSGLEKISGSGVFNYIMTMYQEMKVTDVGVVTSEIAIGNVFVLENRL